MTQKSVWQETLHDKFGQYFAIDNVLYHEKTCHQDLIIFENAAFGRVMALDGVVQTTERDEFIYHEMMAHVPLFAHGQAKHVLIIGGGDGGMLREVARHKTVETITMVEIDAGVVSFCRQYLPNHSAGSYDDPRFKLVIDDGVNFVNQTSQTFDVIISDCTDPIGPGESLFTSAFYEGCHRCLNPNGIFVAQNGVCFLQQDEAIDSHRKLSHSFQDVSFYQAAIPTYFGGIMTFAWASDNPGMRHLSSELIQARFHKAGITCRYYNPAIHTAAFALPQYLQNALSLSSA
ncbi:polyamine aminopropyltransferase [uncultured Cedecea sp.]|uniref:polyamine aminopropyltransferase n=1 Tax=uncultured Cedecea sp. TaxID=988762 RepID=UPI002617C9EE|nr:polyamine aminopropyltransferase [uncultured Cedecea sp.]